MQAQDGIRTFAETHEADVCVVGGGMAGLMAALAAARHGAKTVLMHERPVLGGNASSECRVHICGADRHNSIPYLRETGILEEIRLENLARNPGRNWSVWDTVLYEKARFQDGLALLLNCSANEATVAPGTGGQGPRILSVTGWQTTTQTRHTVRAKIFVDCSGDAILAPLTGAAFRKGRDAKSDYNEPNAPEQASPHTMGMTCAFISSPHETPQPFTPPAWAYKFEKCEQLPYGRGGHHHFGMGYWWVELGGEHDSIRDTEKLRDELLKIAWGVWDHIKNHCPETKTRADCWALDWMQFLPAKRESRRYIGQHILTQSDVLAEGRFDDLVAYGGWAMDDHRSTGFWGRDEQGQAATFHKTPSPYGIPYRSLIARDMVNLMFAGRCHSASHLALSSTRVMGTGCSMGQAVGTAAALAIGRGIDPAGMLAHIRELQQTLLRDDCYLPWVRQETDALAASARISTSQGNGEAVRDGVSRPVGTDMHAWRHSAGDWIAYEFAEPTEVAEASLMLDSALHLDPQMSHWYPLNRTRLTALPPEMPHTFRVEVREGEHWATVARVQANRQRHVPIPVGRRTAGLRYVLECTWGPCDGTNLYGFIPVQ
jgi:hypothetical protein